MRLNGLGVSPGIGVGRALVVTRGSGNLRFRIADRRVPLELERLDAARARSRTQLEHIKKRIATAAGADHAYLFDAQLLMLDDPMLVERAASLDSNRSAERRVGARSRAGRGVGAVRSRGRSLPARAQGGRRRRGRPAVHEPAAQRRSAAISSATSTDRSCLSPTSSARHSSRRWTGSGSRRSSPTPAAGRITPPSSRDRCTCPRSRGSDTPASSFRRAPSSPSTVAAGTSRSSRRRISSKSSTCAHASAARTNSRSRNTASCRRSCRTGRPSGSKQTSNCRRRPSARGNAAPKGSACIDRSSSSRAASATGLDEDAQYAMYVRLIDAMRGRRVTVRTFDVTEGQLGLGASGDAARAPLGLRGLRLSLSFDDIFQAQLRALLRAAIHGPLRIMFPFVTGVEELRAARAAIVQAPRHAAEARHRRADRAGRRHDRGALGGADGRSPLCRSRLLQRRHERPDSILPGGRSHRRPRVGDVRAAASRDSAHAAPRRARCAAPRACPSPSAGRWPRSPSLLPLLTGLGLREFSMAPRRSRWRSRSSAACTSPIPPASPAGRCARPPPTMSNERLRSFWRPPDD